MSVEAFSWALTVPIGGNAKVILLGLANHAHPDGTESYPALDTLAKYAHCDRSTARRNVRKLLAEGWIFEDGHGPRGQVKYRLPVAVPGGGDLTPPHSGEGVATESRGGGTGVRGGVAPMPPEPSIEPFDQEPVRGARARTPSPTRVEVSNWDELDGKQQRILTELRRFADSKGARLDEPKALAACTDFPGRDFVGAAEKMAEWYIAGAGANTRRSSTNATWRKWLGNEAPAALATPSANGVPRQGQAGWVNAEAGDLSRFTFGEGDD